MPFLLAEDGMEPDDLLCSRNARPQKALVGRAQWKINQPPSLSETSKLGGSMYMACIWKDAKVRKYVCFVSSLS